MLLVVRVGNLIVAWALNDRLFKTLTDEVGNNHHRLLMHSNVRGLSRETMLGHFAACLSEILTFHEMENVEHPELADTEWLLKFYCLADVTAIETSSIWEGKAMEMQPYPRNKLELFIAVIETGRLLHFEKVLEFKQGIRTNDPAQRLVLQRPAGFTSSLLQSFKALWRISRAHLSF